MQNKNAKALSVLMALLVLPEPSLAARQPLRPSNYPKNSQAAALHPGQPNRKAKRDGLKRLLAGGLSKLKKSKPGKQGAGNAAKKHEGHGSSKAPFQMADGEQPKGSRSIEILPVTQPTPAAKLPAEHVATIELDGVAPHAPRPGTAPSPKSPLPRLQVLDEMRAGGGAEATAASAPFGAAPVIEQPEPMAPVAAPNRVSGWRGGYHDVKPGEDVSGLSQHYGVTRDSILRYNRVPDNGPIPEGRKLFIPPATGSYALASAAAPAPVRQVARLAAPFRQQPHGRVAAPAKSPPNQVATKPAAGGNGEDDEQGPWDKVRNTVSGVIDGFKRLIGRPSRNSDPEKAAQPSHDVKPPEIASKGQTGMRPHFEWPISGQIASAYGPRRGVPHNGIDISASRGTPVQAAAAGKVIYSSTMHGYGNVIILDHGNQYFTVYAHNQENLVGHASEAHPVDVKAGQKIALVGDSGNAQAPHLHFEVRFQNKATDPLPFLPGGGPLLPQASKPGYVDEDSRG